MLTHYEKIYQKYLDEKNGNSHLVQQISQMERYITDLKRNASPIKTQIIEKETRKTINREKLSKILQSRLSTMINDIVSRRKANAIGRLKELFANFQPLTTTISQVEEHYQKR